MLVGAYGYSKNELTRVPITRLSSGNSSLLVRQRAVGPKISSIGKMCMCVRVPFIKSELSGIYDQI
jgi:hypothetical protein